MDNFTFICILVLTVIYGLCVGSFLNVVIYRLPNNIKMTAERSKCPKCGGLIHWYDNIPLFSFIFLGGKCRSCKEKISFRYPFNEALNMLLWLACLLTNKNNLPLAITYAVACSTAICILWIDIDHYIIYDRFNAILIVAAVCASLFSNGYVIRATALNMLGRLITGLVTAGIILLMGWLVSKKVGAEALGGGDVKLVFAMGMLLNAPKMLLAVILACISALAVITLLKNKKGYDSLHEYPFGPFLSGGLITALICGDTIVKMYSNLF